MVYYLVTEALLAKAEGKFVNPNMVFCIAGQQQSLVIKMFILMLLDKSKYTASTDLITKHHFR